THDPAGAIPDGGDAVQRALDAGAVVLAELADARGDVIDIAGVHQAVGQIKDAAGEPCLGRPAKVEDDLQQILLVRLLLDRVENVRWQCLEKLFQVIRDLVLSWGCLRCHTCNQRGAVDGGPAPSFRRWICRTASGETEYGENGQECRSSAVVAARGP